MRSFLLSLILILSYVSSFSSHVVGSDVSYTCINTRVYNVTFKLYRDCQGIELCGGCQSGTSPVPCNQPINIRGAAHPTGIPHNLPSQSCTNVSFGSQSIPVIPGVSGLDVIQLCAMSRTICDNCNTRTPGTFTPGIEVYTFSGTIDLTGLPASCCWVSVGWGPTCCRNNAITTLQNPGGLTFYNEGFINVCATPCNSSPTFTNEAVAVACAGQDFTYNLGAIDPDGDSLSFRYGQTLVSAGAGAPYASPFSPTVPFPYLGIPGQSPPLSPPLGIYIDPISGDIRFRPMGSFVSNLVIEVLQWKLVNGSYVLMGITRRDIQFYSQPCPNNNPPVIRTYDNDGNTLVGNSFATCAGQQLCFIISAWDNTANWDTTDITWNQSKTTQEPNVIFSTGGTITPLYNPNSRNILGPKFDSIKFCWTPPASVARNLPYYLNVTGKDRACPIPARTNRSFSIIVRPIPQAIINKTNKNCGFYDFSFTQTNTVPLNTSFTQFQIENSPGSNTYITYTSGSVTNHKFITGGWHKIKLRLTTAPVLPSLPNGCPNNNIIDSVLVLTPVDVTARDTFNCFGTPVTVKVNGTHGTPFGNAYRYTFYSGGINGTNVVRIFGPDSNAAINPTIAGATSTYKVVIQDLNGCKDSTTFNILTRVLPSRELPPSVRFCFGTSDTIDAGTSNSTVSIFRWTKSPATPVIGDSTLQKIIPPDSGMYVVRKTDLHGCVNRDTIMVYVNPQVPVSAGPDRTICFNDPVINVNAIGVTAAIDSFQWRQVPITDPTAVLSNSATLTVSPATTTRYQVTGYITYGDITCSYVDTMEIKVNTLPVITRPSNFSLCRNTSVVLMPNVVSTNKPGQITSVWSYPQRPSAMSGNQVRVDSLLNLPPAPPTQARGNIIRLTVTDNDGCSIRDSLVISIFPVPIINAGPARTFCDYNSVFNINPGSQLYVPNGGAFANNEEWFGRGIYKPNPSVNFYAFDPKGADIKLAPDTNIVTYRFTATFPVVNAVVFSPAVPGFTAPSPSGGCVATDTVIFRVIQTPVLEAGIAPPVCKSSLPIDIDVHMIGRSTTAANPLTSYWYFGAPDVAFRPAISGGRTFDPQHPVIPSTTRIYRLVYADTSTTCRVADTTELQVNQNPDVIIRHLAMIDSAVCKTRGNVPFLMTPSGVSSADGTMSSNPSLAASLFDVTNGTFNVSTVPADMYNIKYYYKDPATGCDNRDSINIRVQEAPQIDITDDGNVCEYGAVFNVGFKTAPVSPYIVTWSTPDGNGAIQDNGASGISYAATAADIGRGSISFRATTVDITTDPDVCAAVSDSATYIIKPKPLADFSIAPDKGCVDPRYGIELNSVYTAQNSTAPGSTYKWFMNTGDYTTTPLNPAPYDQTNWNQTFTTAGTYNIHLFVEANGCTDTLVQTVTAWPAPTASFVPDPERTTIAKPFFDFNNQSSISDGSPLNYIWTFPPENFGGPERKDYTESPRRIAFMADTGCQVVKLTAISINGCYDSTTRLVCVEPDITVFIPNVFRPKDVNGGGGGNDDCAYGCNTTFKVSATGFSTIEIYIFNRWGQMVYKYTADSNTFDVSEGWNGRDQATNKECQQDAYIYQINATSMSGKKYSYSGSVTLLR